jgi:hypothetical protein
VSAWDDEQARISAAADPETAGEFERITRPSRIEPIDGPTLFADREQAAGEWLVEPLIPVGRQVALFSEAKSGKSLLSLEVSAAVATGRPVLSQAVGPPKWVVYVDQEMTPNDLRERLTDLGYGPGDDLHRLVYFQLANLPPLDSAAGGLTVEELLDTYRPAMFVLDTMASLVGGREDHSDTYRDFYRHTGRRLKEREVALLRLDHTGKDRTRGQRGSSAKADDVDVVFSLTADDRTVRLRRTHSRVPWVPPEVTLSREAEPVLHHEVTSAGFKREAIETAKRLDALAVPIDASADSALAMLRQAGEGKRKAVVLDAIKVRRLRS